jgi:eukaryotic-like serine/threonine-protein kinase
VRRGLVHRDVSPHNVLLSWEGEVKLADFGVAQMLERSMTAPVKVTVGKRGYMSPEQVNCQELDGRSDLYAVGIVLWELLSHRRFPVGVGRRYHDGIPGHPAAKRVPAGRPS